MTIKAVTLWQPWASLVVAGYKRFETRSWSTRFRGVLAIHAAKREPARARNPFYHATFRRFLYLAGFHRPEDLPRGAVLGTVWLRDIHAADVISSTLDERELAFGDFSPGRYAWELVHPVQYPRPIPTRGRQGLWEWKIPD